MRRSVDHLRHAWQCVWRCSHGPLPARAAPDGDCWASPPAIQSARPPPGPMTSAFASARSAISTRSCRIIRSPNPQRRCRCRRAAAPPRSTYGFDEEDYSLDDFLEHQRVTGFLLIKGGEILADATRTAAPIMIVSSRAGWRNPSSVSRSVLRSPKTSRLADDPIARDAPKLAGNPYGKTTIRNILRMASGVPFREVYDGNDDLARFEPHAHQTGFDHSAARLRSAAK